jgi:recombination protein RecA
MGYSSQSAVLKREIEAKLASRIPAALSPQVQQAPQLMGSGIPAIDALLNGGLPIGGVTEFTGLTSSGRTSMAFSLLAGASPEFACAYIDIDNALDPKSAAAAGIHLQNLLWVRLAEEGAMRTYPVAAVPSATSIATPITVGRIGGGHCGNNHPRTETKGIGDALGTLLNQKAKSRLDKMEGTPGYPNRKMTLAAAPDEQIEYDHFNARHADASDPIRQADRRAAGEARERARAHIIVNSMAKKQERPWNRLDRAIRATDQILQSGGFRVVVLDLASVPSDQAFRIPSATWFRFRRAAQESDAVLLLLTQIACARSSALCVLDCSVGIAHACGDLLSGFTHTAEVARQRVCTAYTKKAPGRVTAWEATPYWMRTAGQ